MNQRYATTRSALGKRTSSGMGVSKRLFVDNSSSYVASMLRPQLEPHFLAHSGVFTNSDRGAMHKGALVARTQLWVADLALWGALRRAAATPSAAESNTPALRQEHSCLSMSLSKKQVVLYTERSRPARRIRTKLRRRLGCGRRRLPPVLRLPQRRFWRGLRRCKALQAGAGLLCLHGAARAVPPGRRAERLRRGHAQASMRCWECCAPGQAGCNIHATLTWTGILFGCKLGLLLAFHAGVSNTSTALPECTGNKQEFSPRVVTGCTARFKWSC